MNVTLQVNGITRQIEIDPKTPLLWVIREQLQLTGTKYGCGMGLCGVCTVHMDGKAIRSCQTAVDKAVGMEITTIEALSTPIGQVLQEAWAEVDVPQCGYCQSGQIMSAAALLHDNKSPSIEEIHQAMNGNLCRCGSYNRIRRAIQMAAQALTNESKT